MKKEDFEAIRGVFIKTVSGYNPQTEISEVNSVKKMIRKEG